MVSKGAHHIQRNELLPWSVVREPPPCQISSCAAVGLLRSTRGRTIDRRVGACQGRPAQGQSWSVVWQRAGDGLGQ